MSTFVLIHGGMHGGWCWRRVRRLLQAKGHEVFTPTLTGLGERAHLGGRDVDLSLHILDVCQCIETEELNHFVLVGHSYAGMVITGVADHLPDRISALVYLDALVPSDGQAAAELVPRGVDYTTFADGMLPPIAGYDFGVTAPQDVAWVRRRITPQSVRTVTEPLRIQRDLSKLRRTYVECVEAREGQSQMQSLAAGARRIAGDPSWSHHRLEAGHDCMITHPVETAELLISIGEGS